jgi:hypothetical protein
VDEHYGRRASIEWRAILGGVAGTARRLIAAAALRDTLRRILACARRTRVSNRAALPRTRPMRPP